MRKIFTILLAIAFVAAGLAAQEKAKKEKSAKEYRVSGYIVRTNAAESTLIVKKGNQEKTVIYNSSTSWTQNSKPAEMSLFKDNENVICFGTYDEKGRLVARRIDLRAKKM
ncbi:MAG TPA: hypothetical protein VGQ11_03155 [Candidatus Acidoferrales bacterium]|jgi:hypothetical protein|nr:hypothetical protein [Candidatus Acidoferrales bacterium]